MILGNNFYFIQWNAIERMANPSLPCPTWGKYIEIVVKSMRVSQFSISFSTMHFSRFYIFIWICLFISLHMSTISLSYNFSLSSRSLYSFMSYSAHFLHYLNLETLSFCFSFIILSICQYSLSFLCFLWVSFTYLLYSFSISNIFDIYTFTLIQWLIFFKFL